MSKEVLTAINHSYELGSYATPELRGLFNEWLGEIEMRVLNFIEIRKRVNPGQLADHFKLSTESILFILEKLAREGRVSLEAAGRAKDNLHLVRSEQS